MTILTSIETLPRHLYPHTTDLLARVFTDGTGGYAVLDADPRNATCAALVVGDFVYLGGSPNAAFVRELAQHHDDELHIMPASREWRDALESDRAVTSSRYTRYAFDTSRFDWEFFFASQPHEQAHAEASGVHVERITMAHVTRHGDEDWFDDLICQFSGPEDFLDRGIGFVVIENNEAVSGASSYAVYNGGIEVEVGTRPDRRGRGYATLASRALLLWGRETGTFVAWDAANQTSKRLAERLGYRDARAYECLLYRLQSSSYANDTGASP